MCEDGCKYEIAKEITLTALMEYQPCQSGIIAYMKVFALYSKLTWGSNTESVFENMEGGLKFLIKHGFIKEIERFSYSHNKIYISQEPLLMKLCRISNESFGWVDLVNVNGKGGSPGLFNSVREAIDYITPNYKVIELDNLTELADWIKQNIKSDNK